MRTYSTLKLLMRGLQGEWITLWRLLRFYPVSLISKPFFAEEHIRHQFYRRNLSGVFSHF